MARRKSAPRPFWLQLPRAFLFPLQHQPLIYLACLALIGFFVGLFFSSLPEQVHFFLRLLFIIPALFLAAGVARYGCKIMLMGARGAWHHAEFLRDDQVPDKEWLFLHRKLLLLLFVLYLASSLAMFVLPVAILPWLLSFLLPLCILLLVQNFSLGEAFDPQRWWNLLRLIGPAYVLPALYWMLAGWIMLHAHGLWSALLDGRMAALTPGKVMDEKAYNLLALMKRPGEMAIFLPLQGYFFWAFCSLLGFVMHQHHEALDVEPLEDVSPADAALQAGLLPPEEKARRQRVRRIEQTLDRGLLAEAWKLAHEEHVKRPGDLDAQQRYWRLMRQMEGHKPLALAEQVAHVIALLLEQNKDKNEEFASVAQVFQQYARTCRRHAHEPLPLRLDATQSLRLADALWIARDAENTLVVLQGFDARFEEDLESVAQAFALAVRVHAQGLHNFTKAGEIFVVLKARYPDSIWRREAGTFLAQYREQHREMA